MKVISDSKNQVKVSAGNATSATANSTPAAMPGNVRAIHVLSLLEQIGELGSDVHFSSLAEKIGVDVSTLPTVLEAAEMLGFIKRDGADIALTEEALKYRQQPRMSKGILNQKLVGVEPFQTAAKLASRKGGTTAEEVAETLAKEGIQWHYKPEKNEPIVRNLLIHWTIKSGLLSYNGKNGKFQLAKA
jgi:hypothetical protein